VRHGYVVSARDCCCTAAPGSNPSRRHIGVNKILLPTKYRRRQKIVFNKISALTEYRFRQNIGKGKISATPKYRF
jgi:hypothetical protein